MNKTLFPWDHTKAPLQLQRQNMFLIFLYNVLPYFLKDDDTVKKMNILWIGERSLVK